MGKEKDKKKSNLKYPKAVKAVTAGMALTLVAILGICAYAGASGYFVGKNVMTSFQAVMGSMGGSGGGSGGSTNPDSPGVHMTNMSTMPPEFAMWILLWVNNTGTVGLAINDLVVNVTITSLNSTLLLNKVSNIGTIPFGQSVLANITMIEAPIADALALKYSQPVFNVMFSVGYLVSSMTFGITLPMTGGFGGL